MNVPTPRILPTSIISMSGPLNPKSKGERQHDIFRKESTHVTPKLVDWIFKKAHVGNDQEKVQSDSNSYSNYQGGKKLN